MKRMYTKPKLYAETFELAEHIASCKTSAGGVAIDANYQNPDACYYSDNGFALFNVGVTGCPSTFDEDSFASLEDYITTMKQRTVCYNAFIDGNFFAS